MIHYLLNVNGRVHSVDADEDTPLLWVLRDAIGLTGTKYGCGRGFCGACTVHLDGAPTLSCSTLLSEIQGRNILTIEGLAEKPGHPLLQAWLDEEVTQCGYCQPGQIMAAAALLARKPKPTYDDIHAALSGNLCRCGTYLRIRRAVLRAAEAGVTK